MKRKYGSKYHRYMLVFVVSVWGVLGIEARAQDKATKLPFLPHVNGVFASNEGFLEIGPEFKKGHWLIRPLISLPLNGDKSAPVVQLDRYSNTWRGALSVEHDRLSAGESGPIKHRRLGFQGNWGVADYDFFPGDGMTKNTETQHSFAVELRGFWFKTKGEEFASQWAPQIRFRYAREWNKAKETGVVVPSANGDPDTVKDLVREPPATKPSFSAHFAVPFYSGSKTPVGFGPALSYTLIGSVGSYNPFKKTGRLRLETWIYYFPAASGVVNVRFGISPFLSWRTHGEDNFQQWEYGILLQFRVGTNLLEF